MTCFMVWLWLVKNLLALVVMLRTSLSGKRSEGLKQNGSLFLDSQELRISQLLVKRPEGLRREDATGTCSILLTCHTRETDRIASSTFRFDPSSLAYPSAVLST